MARKRRLGALALAFLIGGCAVQTAAPRPSETPDRSAQPTATARKTNPVGDVVYLRSVAPGSSSILAIDARTGETLRTLPNGAMSSDRSTVYAPELVNGATQTIVRVIEIASATQVRSFTIEGAFDWITPGAPALSRDGRYLVLGYPAGKLDDQWVSRLAVVDTIAGRIEAKFEMRSASVFNLSAIAPDGRTVYLAQGGEGATRVRIFDVPTATLLPIAEGSVSDLRQNSYRTAGVLSPDGRWMYSLDSGNPTTNCTSTDGPRCVSNATAPSLIALDLVSRRVARVALPMDQVSTDFEKYLLWSVGVAPGGDKVYAINPALGVVDEIDAGALALRRTAKMTVSRSDGDAFAAVARFFFPVADAKRYVTTGAVFSPDGQRIYAVASKGIAVIDVATLSSQPWQTDNREFDALALTSDGQRLYAASNANGVMSIMATSDGARLGEFRIAGYGEAILRIDSNR